MGHPPLTHIDMDDKAREEMIDWLLDKAQDIDYFYFHQCVKEIYFDSNY